MSKLFAAMEAYPGDDRNSDDRGYGSEDFEQARRGSRVSSCRVASVTFRAEIRSFEVSFSLRI